MSDELVKVLRSTYRATTFSKFNTISAGQTVVHTVAPAVVYRNPDGPAAADEIERLTAQLAEARESERAAEDRAWQRARELVRGTNADMCETAEQAYRIICGEMTNAVNSRELRTLEGRVAADADPVRDTLADSDGDDGA